MAACRFVVTKVALERNIRGQEMRRIELQAAPSDPFRSDEPLPVGVTEPAPDGTVRLLVGAAYAKRFALGDVFDLMFREREA